MLGILLMAAFVLVGSLVLWRFGADPWAAAVLCFMLLIPINIAGYYWFGWWGGP